jgi:flagellar hook assembly protein FlgD
LSAYPNPFNPKTEIRFHLEESANLELDIYDLAGRHLRGLVKPSFLEAGEHRVSWDGRDERGVPLSAGIYFCSLKAGLRSESMKLVLLK